MSGNVVPISLFIESDAYGASAPGVRAPHERIAASEKLYLLQIEEPIEGMLEISVPRRGWRACLYRVQKRFPARTIPASAVERVLPDIPGNGLDTGNAAAKLQGIEATCPVTRCNVLDQQDVIQDWTTTSEWRAVLVRRTEPGAAASLQDVSSLSFGFPVSTSDIRICTILRMHEFCAPQIRFDKLGKLHPAVGSLRVVIDPLPCIHRCPALPRHERHQVRALAVRRLPWGDECVVTTCNLLHDL